MIINCMSTSADLEIFTEDHEDSTSVIAFGLDTRKTLPPHVLMIFIFLFQNTTAIFLCKLMKYSIE